MLTPEQKRNIPTALTDKYAELAEFILRDLARRIADGAKLTDTAEYQLYRAKALGLSEKEIAAKVAEINGEAAAVIEELIYSAADTADRNDREHLGASDAVATESNEPLYKLMKAQVAYTCSECENLTNTLGFADHNSDGTVCYRSLTDMYRRQMDAAQLKVMNGVTDYTTALRQAVNKLAASGVRSIDYESGCSRTVEAATRNALMTSISQVTNKISEQNAEEFGADGWEMSAHSGARPSHAVYQGRQYTQKEYEQKIRDLLNDYGCRHDAYPIILGISKPVYTEEELKNIDPPPFTYEGRRYTAYEAQQQMRKMERAMRRQKDRCIVADSAGDKDAFTAASIKLRRQKDIYEDFCRKADSFTQYERTIVGGYDRHLSGKTGAVTRKARAFERAQIRLTDIENSGTIRLRINLFDKTDPLYLDALSIEEEPGYEDVCLHGSPHSVQKTINGILTNMNAAEFAKYLKANGYKGGDIRLAACSTGSGNNSFAQQLSKELGIRVKAPDMDVYYAPDEGVLFVGAPYGNIGRWRIFENGDEIE